jgi:RIO kinase 1
MTNYNNNDFDLYNSFEAEFDPMRIDRGARRKRKKKINHIPKKTQDDIIQEIADITGIEGGFETTYKPAKHEAVWLLESLKILYHQALITDVMSMVKGGKEASVYRCKAHESTGQEFLAAKVYRPRMFCNLRNDKMYREGRQVLMEDGRPVDARDVRTVRAIGKKSAYGLQVAHTSWLMHEFNAMKALYQAGADVPEPIAAGENVILMSYVGDEQLPAPPLHTVELLDDEVQPLFDNTLRNIKLMLEHGMIHGDLSEYNILYWAGEITFIDFPQVVDVEMNSNANTILKRDIVRVCQYFNQFGLNANPDEIHNDLWAEYGIADDSVAKAIYEFDQEQEEEYDT